LSEIRANTVSDAAGTGPVTLTGQYAAKVWVNFNGTGTVAIRASGNVSSITDNGTGNYVLTFTNATANSNYSVVTGVTGGRATTDSGLAASIITATDGTQAPLTQSTTQIGVASTYVATSSRGDFDANTLCFAIHGDLA